MDPQGLTSFTEDGVLFMDVLDTRAAPSPAGMHPVTLATAPRSAIVAPADTRVIDRVGELAEQLRDPSNNCEESNEA